MSAIEIVFEIFQVLIFIILLLQLLNLRRNLNNSVRTTNAYHERLKKQSTLEYCGRLWAKARLELESEYDVDFISKEQTKEMFENTSHRAKVHNLLGALEHISAGVNSGIYDEDILYRMSATSIINNFNKFKQKFQKYFRQNYKSL